MIKINTLQIKKKADTLRPQNPFGTGYNMPKAGAHETANKIKRKAKNNAANFFNTV